MKNIGTKTIMTDRLILRKIKMKDALDAYNNWCSSFNVARYVIWDRHSSVEETKKLFKSWIDDYSRLDTYRWVVELKQDHQIIGTIDVASKRYIEYGSCEIGYCYGEKFWGHGYATEALKAVIKFLFEEVDVDSLYATHMSHNPASGEVMKKALMKYEGTLRNRIVDGDGIRNDLLSYSITKDEYFDRGVLL